MSVGVVYTYFITKMVVNVLGIVGEKLEGATDKDSYSPPNYDHASPNEIPSLTLRSGCRSIS